MAQITGTDSTGINVSAPINSNIAPPGHYLIHIINNQDVPSHAQIVQLPGTQSELLDGNSFHDRAPKWVYYSP